MSDQQISPRILIIDDDHDLLNLLEKMLSRVGMDPITVADGSAGVEALSHDDPYDLLILDLMLPDISGFEILAQVRADSRYNHMPVLILSAMADPETISKGLGMGADGYLTKPYLPNTLTSRVRALLDQGRRAE